MSEVAQVPAGAGYHEVAGGVNGQGMDPAEGQCEEEGKQEEEPLSIIINNVVCSFSTKCHLNLKRVAMEGSNVEYRREHGMLNMRIRNPFTTASIWSSGKITCTGATSETDSKIAARKFARKLQKLGYKVKFSMFRVVNVLGTCSLPFAINITEFSRKHKNASYEPELHPGVTYRIPDPKATLKIFSTGSITVTAPRTANVEAAIQHIYPLVHEFSAGAAVKKSQSEQNLKFVTKKRVVKRPDPIMYDDEEEDEYEELDSEFDSMDSDESFDSEESLN